MLWCFWCVCVGGWVTRPGTAAVHLPTPEAVAAGVVFPEFEVEYEPEPSAVERQRAHVEGMDDVLARGAAAEAGVEAEVAQAMEAEPVSTGLDSAALAFSKRLAARPRQCLRYVHHPATGRCS